IADDSASEDAAVRVAQALYDDPAVVAVVGHLTSGASIAAAQVYGAAGHPVVMISPSASSPELSGISPYILRICPTDVSYGGALARFAWRALGARRAGVIFVNNDYGRGERNATFVADYARAHPGERPDHRGAGAYDAVLLLTQAIAAVGPDRAAVRNYLAEVGRGVAAFDGVTGKIAFDTTGNVPSKSVVIGVVRSGRLVAEGSQ